MKKHIFLIALCCLPVISHAQAKYWAGSYTGFSSSVISTTITNETLNNVGFTNAAFGVEAGYNYAVNQALVLGVNGNVNVSPFSNSAYVKTEYRMNNKTSSFGSLLGVMGAPISPFIMLFANMGVGYLHTQTSLTTNTGLYSDHSGTQITPVIGAGITYKNPCNIFYGISANYYMPTSKAYYSDVAGSEATLRKGLMQAKLTLGYYYL